MRMTEMTLGLGHDLLPYTTLMGHDCLLLALVYPGLNDRFDKTRLQLFYVRDGPWPWGSWFTSLDRSNK